MAQRGLKELYIFTLCLAMFNKLPNMEIPWWFKYIHCMIWIGIYIYMTRVKLRDEEHNYLNQCIATVRKCFLTPYFIFILVSPIGWIFYIDSTQINMVTRAISSSIQFLLIVYSVVATAYIFKQQLFTYTFQAMVINYSIIIIIAIYKCGIVDFIETGLVPFGSAANRVTDDLLSVKVLEVHDVTFAAGFFFIYFLIWFKRVKKHRLLYLLLSIALLYLGYKRIEIGALALIVCFTLLINTKSKSSIKFWNIIYSLGILLVMYIFIWLIDSGTLFELSEQYNINFMNREKTYAYMAQFFSASPLYIGRGMSAGIRLNLQGIANGVFMVQGHSDIMFNYIDYGFWGFAVWIIYCCYIVTKKMQLRYGNDAAKIWMLFTAYAFITYITDNTAGYFAFQISYMVIIFHVIYTKKKLPTLKTWNNE